MKRIIVMIGILGIIFSLFFVVGCSKEHPLITVDETGNYHVDSLGPGDDELANRMAEVLTGTARESSKHMAFSLKVFSAVDNGTAIWESCPNLPSVCATVYVNQELWAEYQKLEKELKYSLDVVPFGYWIQPMSKYKPKEEKKDEKDTATDKFI